MKKEKMNDKGFSLVELIIVIAIMAVLVVVLAPQYLKYVEKSRVSADATTAATFESAMSILAADTDVSLDTTKTYSVTSADTGAITISDDLKSAFSTIDINKTYKYTSTKFKTATPSITLTYDGTNKMWKVTNTAPSVDN